MPEENRLITELEKLMDIRDTELESNSTSSILNYNIMPSTEITPKIYEDKHGLPVTYDAATHEKQKNTKSDGISMLWHELLSPLTIIKGYTSTLLQLNDDITKEQKLKYIQGIEAASNRMIRLMENLRDITRLEEPNNLFIQRISLPDLLRSIVIETQNQTTKHCIRVRTPKRLTLVNADPDKIEQVIYNLLVNAVKYSPNGGDIDIEVGIVQNEQELIKMYGETPLIKLPSIIVSIADTGVGIPEDELENIFRRFYRVKNKLTYKAQGAGLGLYICKIIVEAHNGHIWARNRSHDGSIFSFSIPLHR